MKEALTVIYTCEHCGKYYKQKHHAVYHESICRKNPINMPVCFNGCRYLDQKNAVATNHIFCPDDEMSVKVFYCNCLKTFVYPPIAKAKGNVFELNDGDNVIMPLECEHFNILEEDQYEMD